MRTTLTLDADVARGLKKSVRGRKVSFKQAVNEALRNGLKLEGAAGTRTPFVVKPHKSGLKAGIDPHKLNHLAGELEDEAVLKSLFRR